VYIINLPIIETFGANKVWIKLNCGESKTEASIIIFAALKLSTKNPHWEEQ
tara:strand:+ start:1454 stop:1606 length:153 start_codon:yes stop_codon:yes gene_type:complete